MRKPWILPSLLLLLTLASACVVSPTDWQRITPSQPMSLTGFASQPGMAVRLQAKNQRTGAWDVIATYTSSTTPTTINSDTLYYWSGSLTFTQANSVDDWRCYFAIPGTSPCQVPEPAATAQIRLVQQDGFSLTSFAEGGLDCVITKLDAGTAWTVAGYECRDDNSPVINLRWVL